MGIVKIFKCGCLMLRLCWWFWWFVVILVVISVRFRSFCMSMIICVIFWVVVVLIVVCIVFCWSCGWCCLICWFIFLKVRIKVVIIVLILCFFLCVIIFVFGVVILCGVKSIGVSVLVNGVFFMGLKFIWLLMVRVNWWSLCWYWVLLWMYGCLSFLFWICFWELYCMEIEFIMIMWRKIFCWRWGRWFCVFSVSIILNVWCCIMLKFWLKVFVNG